MVQHFEKKKYLVIMLQHFEKKGKRNVKIIIYQEYNYNNCLQLNMKKGFLLLYVKKKEKKRITGQPLKMIQNNKFKFFEIN